VAVRGNRFELLARGSGDEGVSDWDEGVPVPTDLGPASLDDFLSHAQLSLVDTQLANGGELIMQASLLAPMPAPAQTGSFVLCPVDFASLTTGGSEGALGLGRGDLPPFIWIGEVPVSMAASGAPPSREGTRSPLGFPAMPTSVLLGPEVTLGQAANRPVDGLGTGGPHRAGPLGAVSQQGSDARHVSLGQSSTTLDGIQALGFTSSASTPTPPVNKWLWLRAGTLDPSLGFPASTRDISRFHRRAKTLRSLPNPSFDELSFAVMEQNWRGGQP
jgi:hypothetical protein